ncbi:MAG: hypothetical protein ACQEWV_13875 [Bacillota bacterium]
MSIIDQKVNETIVGVVIVENRKGFIKLENGVLVELKENDFIEVRNRNDFHRTKLEVLIKTKTSEGISAFAGIEARAKINR